MVACGIALLTPWAAGVNCGVGGTQVVPGNCIDVPILIYFEQKKNITYLLGIKLK
jgi:hypothetical protein